MIYLLGATIVLLCALEALAIAFWWANIKRIPTLERGWETVCGACDGRKKVMVRTPQGFESVACPHCGGTGLVVKGKKR